jgi:DNA-directed RNA polymerase subunit RPC12/RpoP
MARCETCGNEYTRPIEVAMDGTRHVFDSFECAVHKLAPTCAHCGCRILGHGVESERGTMYCCSHCARAQGHAGATDQVS